jgi:hypothetical protein
MGKGRTTPDWKYERPAGQPKNLNPGLIPQPPEAEKQEETTKAETSAKLTETQGTSYSWAPRPKVAAAATTVPFSGLVLWAVEQFGVEMPAYVAGDVAILMAVLVAYLVPDRR